MTSQPLRRSLSHSQAETWQACPRRWQLTKLDKVPQAPSEALILGSAVHAAIEQDGIRATRREPRMPASLLDLVFRDALNKESIAADPRGMLAPFQRTAMLKRGQAMLDAYVREIQPHYHPLATEAPFEHRIADSDWTFSGRIDARTYNARDGAGVIIDHKTSSRAWPKGAEHTKPQADAYLWASRIADWQPEVKRVVFVIYTGDSVELRATTRTEASIARYIDGVRRTASDIERATQNGQFEPRPTPLCGWCQVLHACPVGQQWLADHGRKPQPEIQRFMEAQK